MPGRFFADDAVHRLPVNQAPSPPRVPSPSDGSVRAARYACASSRWTGSARRRRAARRHPTGDLREATLLGRSPGRDLVFWDQHADLDGDGREELWFPDGGGAGTIRVVAGSPQATRTLQLESASRGVTDDEHLLRRHAYVPTLVAVDLDGDGRAELVGYRDGELVVWPFAEGAPQGAIAPAWRWRCPSSRRSWRRTRSTPHASSCSTRTETA